MKINLIICAFVHKFQEKNLKLKRNSNSDLRISSLAHFHWAIEITSFRNGSRVRRIIYEVSDSNSWHHVYNESLNIIILLKSLRPDCLYLHWKDLHFDFLNQLNLLLILQFPAYRNEVGKKTFQTYHLNENFLRIS